MSDLNDELLARLRRQQSESAAQSQRTILSYWYEFLSLADEFTALLGREDYPMQFGRYRAQEHHMADHGPNSLIQWRHPTVVWFFITESESEWRPCGIAADGTLVCGSRVIPRTEESGVSAPIDLADKMKEMLDALKSI